MGRELRGPYRFVFIDAGETLVQLDPPFEAVAAQEASRLGTTVAADVMQAAASKAYGEAATRPTAKRYTTSTERSRAFWGEMYERLAGAIGVNDSKTFASRMYARATRLDAYGCIPDAPEVLRELRALGARVVVASNWGAVARRAAPPLADRHPARRPGHLRRGGLREARRQILPPCARDRGRRPPPRPCTWATALRWMSRAPWRWESTPSG